MLLRMEDGGLGSAASGVLKAFGYGSQATKIRKYGVARHARSWSLPATRLRV